MTGSYDWCAGHSDIFITCCAQSGRFPVAHRAVNVFCKRIKACWQFERCQTGVKREVEQWFVGKRIEVVYCKAEEVNKICPAPNIVEPLSGRRSANIPVKDSVLTRRTL